MDQSVNQKNVKMFIKQDKCGYPNNQSVVAFAPNEQPTESDIVYYEIINNVLVRKCASFDFPENCQSVDACTSTEELKAKVKERFPSVIFGERLRLNKKKCDQNINDFTSVFRKILTIGKEK